MKIASFFFVALFVFVAALQFNDPDPIYWIAVYAGAALVVLGNGLNRYSEFWTAVVIGGVVAGMLWTVVGFWGYIQSGAYGSIFGDMRGPAYIEETREFLGLAITLTTLLYFRRKASEPVAGA